MSAVLYVIFWYSSFLKYLFGLELISEDIMVSLLFFCATLSIFLQSGLPRLNLHVMIYTFTFVCSYISCVAFMDWFYTDQTGLDSFKGRALKPTISWAQEITFIVSVTLLGFAFLMLEKFVKSYANSLLERSRQIKTLEKEKQELAEEVKKIKGDEGQNVDLDAPVQKVIHILQTMANASGNVCLQRVVRLN